MPSWRSKTGFGETSLLASTARSAAWTFAIQGTFRRRPSGRPNGQPQPGVENGRLRNFLLWTSSGTEQVRLVASPLRGEGGKEIPSASLSLRFLRYVLSDGGKPGAREVVADVLDAADRLDLAPHTTPRVDLSRRAARRRAWPISRAGASGGQGRQAAGIPVDLEVLPLVLPPPSQWSFRLDLWQDPWSVARYHGVRPWSEAHWAVLEPHLRMLAEAGQKFITTYMIPEAWARARL